MICGKQIIDCDETKILEIAHGTKAGTNFFGPKTNQDNYIIK